MNTGPNGTKPRWRRIARRLGIVLGMLGVIAFTANVIWGYVETRRLNAEIAAIKAAGEPLTFRDLDAGWPEVSEEDDAGPFYEAALALVRGRTASELWDAYEAYGNALRKSPTSRPASDVTQRIERHLADNALALDMLDRGAERPACGFKIGVQCGIGGSLERLSRVRAVAKPLGLRALVRAADGDGDGAVNSLIGLIRMQRVFDRQPILIAHLNRVSIAGLACWDTRIVLETNRPSDAALARLQEALTATDVPRPLERVILAERVYGVEMMRDLVAGAVGSRLPEEGGANLEGQWPASGFWSRPLAKHWAVGYLRDMGKQVQDSRKPLHESLRDAGTNESAKSMFGQLLTPALTRLAVLTARSVADTRCAAVAVMIERYRRTHGCVPPGLDVMVPQFAETIPSDPFTGRPLLYRADDKAYVVYSVGENGTDDGGDVDRDADERDRQPTDTGIRIRLSPP